MRSILAGLLVVLGVACGACRAAAQEADDLPVPAGGEESVAEARAEAPTEAVEPVDEALLAEELYQLRLGHREARANEGWALVGFGGASIATGGVLTGLGAAQNDERLLWAGVGTLSWGAINALLSVFLFDLPGSVRAGAEADRTARGADLLAAREDAARDEYHTGAIIALNAGLDFFYVATGVLLAVIGGVSSPGEWSYGAREGLVGYGAAMAAQGEGLLIYDVVTWLLAQDRGDRTLDLGR